MGAFDGLREQVTQAAADAFAAAGTDIAEMCAAEARQLPGATGVLGDSIRNQPLSLLAPVFVSEVRAEAEHAVFVFDGTKPHEIRPKDSGGVLRFESGGQVVFAKSVHHPGNAPNPILARVIEENWSDTIQRRLSERLSG